MSEEEPATGTVVTDENAPERIEQCMSELVDFLAAFPHAPIDARAWSRLLIYCPGEIVRTRAALLQNREIDRFLNGENHYEDQADPRRRQ
jgi:hypothetical protein